jgi:hypothetical protein
MYLSVSTFKHQALSIYIPLLVNLQFHSDPISARSARKCPSTVPQLLSSFAFPFFKNLWVIPILLEHLRIGHHPVSLSNKSSVEPPPKKKKQESGLVWTVIFNLLFLHDLLHPTEFEWGWSLTTRIECTCSRICCQKLVSSFKYQQLNSLHQKSRPCFTQSLVLSWVLVISK